MLSEPMKYLDNSFLFHIIPFKQLCNFSLANISAKFDVCCSKIIAASYIKVNRYERSSAET